MRPESRALLDKALESIQAAETLKRDRYFSFSASRAYYALFYIAEALLIEKGLSYSSHSAVIAAFGKEYARTKIMAPYFHRYLLDAQDMRNMGDYSINPSIDEKQVDDVLAWANEFLITAQQYLDILPN
jgi:uncharacterized protein (UPF0332 family)